MRTLEDNAFLLLINAVSLAFAWILCREEEAFAHFALSRAAAHREYKMRLVASEPEDTVITALFGPEWPGAPMRVLMNNAVRRALGSPVERSPAPSTIGETTVFGRQYAMPLNSSILPTVHTRGDFDEMCLAAGAGLSFVCKIEPAAQIVRDIMDGAAAALQTAASAYGFAH